MMTPIIDMTDHQLQELMADYRNFAADAEKKDMRGSHELFSLVANLAAEVLRLRATTRFSWMNKND